MNIIYLTKYNIYYYKINFILLILCRGQNNKETMYFLTDNNQSTHLKQNK